ncbi:MAG TPA: patatin-like phospholipase family protein [Burkholderiales bacterium]|nr:patatin-like phospholipase family protein [Burkholderiales bacterium]
MRNKGTYAVTPALPGQVVLVLQGGGALGAYQVGVYEALHEAGIEPDWVIGTSIGAINAAIIAGNKPQDRVTRLCELWACFQQPPQLQALQYFSTYVRGIPGFFSPRMPAWGVWQANVGLDAASYYTTDPLRETLASLIDLDVLNHARPRLTVGAVNVKSGELRYFDSRDGALGLEEVMASGALPPGFPAIRVQGQAFWDGGLYSNTPLEAVLDDNPRRDSVIFSVTVWQPTGHEPESIWQVMAREKDIRYATRDDSHIARQRQIHRLRHVIRELEKELSSERRHSPKCRELASWGCGTTMHVVRLLAPALDGEDYMKDIDFSAAGIRFRREAGYADARRMIERAPWNARVDPMEGVVVHELSARTAAAGGLPACMTAARIDDAPRPWPAMPPPGARAKFTKTGR